MTEKYTSRDMALEKPAYMATDSYALNNAKLIEDYARLKVFGVHQSIAFRRLWGEEFWDSFAQARIYAVESTEVYENAFRDILQTTPLNKMWNDKLSVHKLLSLVNNPFINASVQLKAISELNILMGITIVDESGKTRKGNNMSDFYKSVGTENKRSSDTKKLAAGENEHE